MIDALPFLAELSQSWKVTITAHELEVHSRPPTMRSGTVFFYRHDGTPKSLGEAISRAYAGSAPDRRASSEDL